MSSEDVAIRIEGISKRYEIYDQPRDRLKQFILPRLRRSARLPHRDYFHEFWALRDISFDVRKGETVGIVGRNGSGKSTLLQIVCGTLAPTLGTVETRGRIAALLELGSGFNPEFTGRENVYMNAALLGLHREEIDERFERIAAFADIGDFIEQPVKTYSTGMYVRLAFAVAANVDADILVIDEALAVGDIFFVQKCMRFLHEFRARGTLVFVSHDTSAIVHLCERALLLDQGACIARGSPKEVCRVYLEQLYCERGSMALRPATAGAKEPAAGTQSMDVIDKGVKAAIGGHEVWAHEQKSNQIEISPFNVHAQSLGLRGARIVNAGFFKPHNEQIYSIKGGEEVCFSIFVVAEQKILRPALGLVLKDRLGQYLFTEGSSWGFEKFYGTQRVCFEEGDHVRIDFYFPMPVLARGDYTLTVAVADGLGHDHVQHHLVHDAVALRSLDSRLDHGIFGFSDVKIRMTFARQGTSWG